jgi:hypothetical protein
LREGRAGGDADQPRQHRHNAELVRNSARSIASKEKS